MFFSSLDARMNLKSGEEEGLIKWTKQIILQEFPLAFNPSIIKNEKGYLMAFRYCPNNHNKDHSISKIGIVQFDASFNRISKPCLVENVGEKAPPHLEDPRLFLYQNEICIIYNNCLDKFQTSESRRDMWMGKLVQQGDRFFLTDQIKFFHKEKGEARLIQKNWIPFISDDQLYLIYMLDPFEVIIPDMETGLCSAVWNQESLNNWQWGQLRGSTPPVLADGELLAFFHSSTSKPSIVQNNSTFQYYIGVYTFSATYPFKITSMSPAPIISKTFYSRQQREKKVIFPAGLVEDDQNYYICYGRNDKEMWIAAFDKIKLKQSLVKIKKSEKIGES